MGNSDALAIAWFAHVCSKSCSNVIWYLSCFWQTWLVKNRHPIVLQNNSFSNCTQNSHPSSYLTQQKCLQPCNRSFKAEKITQNKSPIHIILILIIFKTNTSDALGKCCPNNCFTGTADNLITRLSVIKLNTSIRPRLICSGTPREQNHRIAVVGMDL